MVKRKNIFSEEDEAASASPFASAAIADTPIASRTRSSGGSVASSADLSKPVINKGGTCPPMTKRNDISVKDDEDGTKISTASAGPDTPIASRTRSGDSVATALSKLSSTCRSGNGSSTDSIDTIELITTAREKGGNNKPRRKPEENLGDPKAKSTCSKTSSARRKSPATNKNNQDRSKRHHSFTPVQKAIIVEEMNGSDESACQEICKKHDISFKALSKWKEQYRNDELLLSKADLIRKRWRDNKRKKVFSRSYYKRITRDPEYMSKESEFSFEDKLAIVKEALRDDTLSVLGKLCEKHDIPYRMLLDWKQKYQDQELHLSADEIRAKRSQDCIRKNYREKRLACVQDSKSQKIRKKVKPTDTVTSLNSRKRGRDSVTSCSVGISSTLHDDIGCSADSVDTPELLAGGVRAKLSNDTFSKVEVERLRKSFQRQCDQSPIESWNGGSGRKMKRFAAASLKNENFDLTSEVSSLSSFGSHLTQSESGSEKDFLDRSGHRGQPKKQSIRKYTSAEAVERGITPRLHKAYLLAKKNREWFLTNDFEDDKSACIESVSGLEELRRRSPKKELFPLEMQFQYAKERKAHIKKLKLAASNRMKARNMKDVRWTTEKNFKVESKNYRYHPEKIPINIAERVIKNIKRSGVNLIGENIQEYVTTEVTHVLQSISSSRENNFMNAEGARSYNRTDDFFNPIDWDCSNRERDVKLAVYENMPIPNIDHLVGWATSHRPCHGNDPTDTRNISELLHLEMKHITSPPPPPSQVEFLLRRFGRRVTRSAGRKHSSGGPCIELAKRMSPSAGVAFGIAVEDIFTVALMPLAKKHVTRCRYLENQIDRCTSNIDGNVESSVGKSGDIDPFVAWTLCPQDAIADFKKKPSLCQDT